MSATARHSSVDLLQVIPVVEGMRTGGMRRHRSRVLVVVEIGQGGVLDQPVRDVDPEAVNPAVEPEPQDVDELVADLAVRPVEVRLGRRRTSADTTRRASRRARPLGSNQARRIRCASCWAAARRSARGPAGRHTWPVPASRVPRPAPRRNHPCRCDVWLGTMSMMTRSPWAWESRISASALANVPNSGAMSR